MKGKLRNQSVYTLGITLGLDKPPATHRFVTGACLCPRATCELAGVWSDVWVGSRLRVPVNGTAMDLMIRPSEMPKNAMPMKIPRQSHMTHPCHAKLLNCKQVEFKKREDLLRGIPLVFADFLDQIKLPDPVPWLHGI